MVVVMGGRTEFHEVPNAILFTELDDEVYCVEQEGWRRGASGILLKCPSRPIPIRKECFGSATTWDWNASVRPLLLTDGEADCANRYGDVLSHLFFRDLRRGQTGGY